MKTSHLTEAKAKRRWQADPSTIYTLMGKHQAFTPDEQGAIITPPRLSFERFRMGTAQEDDFHCLAAAANISLVRAEKISPLVESVCLIARDALLRVKGRHQKTGRWGLDGPAIGEIADMLDVYQQLVELLLPRQLQEAMSEALRRARAGQGLSVPEFTLEQ